MEIKGTEKQTQECILLCRGFIFSSESKIVFSLRSPFRALHPYTPCLPLQYELSPTQPYGLKDRFKERMTQSQAGMEASEDTNYFLKLSAVWFMKAYKGCCLSFN